MAVSSEQTAPSFPEGSAAKAEGAARVPAFDDVVIAVRAAPDGLLVTATSRHGLVSATRPVPELATPVTTEDEARQAGATLAETALTEQIGDLIIESINLASDNSPNLFVDLNSDTLRALPWETLYDRERSRFFALNQNLPLGRADYGEIPLARREVEETKLRVRFVSSSLDDATALAKRLSLDSGIETTVGLPASTPRRPPHVVILLDSAVTGDIPDETLVAIVTGDTTEAYQAALQTEAGVALPAELPDWAKEQFLSVLIEHLARGEPVPAAVSYARVALTRSEPDSIEWAKPILVCSCPPAPLVRPNILLAEVGGRVKEETVSWVKDAAAGVLGSVAVFLFGLLLFRFGFTGESEFELDIFSPYSIYQSFSSLIIELSSFQENFLLGAAALIGLLAAIVGILWWTTPDERPPGPLSPFARLQDSIGHLRRFTFLLVAALTVLAAYGYQQYLWRVQLPIPEDKIGIAITRETAAATFRDELAAKMAEQGLGERVVIRELPVEFNASDTGRARTMAGRIDADAVIIYRATGPEDDREYNAYLVFTDPSIGVALPGRSESAPVSDITTSDGGSTLQIKDGVSIPALRSSDLSQLVSGAAGILAFEDNRRRDAITSLEQARPADVTDPNAAVINFYLANAYTLDHQDHAAAAAYEAAAASLERRAESGPLGPEDELLLAKTYTEIGRLAANRNQWTDAINWYDRALSHRNELLARGSSLANPAEVRALYARLYSFLSTAYRATNNPEEERFWTQRTTDELAELRGAIDQDDPAQLVALSGATLMAGDCVGAADAVSAALALDPTSVDARINAAAIAQFQGLLPESRAYLEEVVELNPDDIRAVDQLGLSYLLQAIDIEHEIFEPTYLEASDSYFATAIAADPDSVLAYNSLAENATWRGSDALLDLNALLAGDDVIVAGRQVLWLQDPHQQATAIAAFTDAIERQRIVARELTPGDPAAAIQLAGAYAERMRVRANALIYRQDDIGTPDLNRFGEQMLADAGEVAELARGVLADPDSPYGERLRATALLLEALNWSWNWSYFYDGDQLVAAETAAALRDEIEAAHTLLDQGVPQTQADANAIRAIYFEEYRYAALIMLDNEQAAAAAAARDSVQDPPVPDSALLRSVCFEERSRLAGDAALEAGDVTAARDYYTAALAANPSHEPAIEGLVVADLLEADLEAALENARRATEASPGTPTAWSALAVMAALNAESDVRDEALATFVERIESHPPNERVRLIGNAIELLQAILEFRPADAANLAGATAPLLTALDEVSAEPVPPSLSTSYGHLGRFALMAGDPEMAVVALERAIELYEHDPIAKLDLALALLAQDQDASGALDAATTEIGDPIWATATVGRADLVTRMRDEVATVTEIRGIETDPFQPAIDAIDAAEIELGLASPPAATPKPDELYTSPNYGVTIEIVPPWSLDSSSSEGGADSAIFTTGTSEMLINVLGPISDTPQGCLDLVINVLADNETMPNRQEVSVAAGTPEPESDRAFTEFTYFDPAYPQPVPNDNNAQARVECRFLNDGVITVAIIHVAPLDQFEAESIHREALLATLRPPE